MTTQITSSADLPRAAKAREFYEEFEKYKKYRNITEREYSFPDFDEVSIEFDDFSMRYGEAEYTLFNTNIKIPKNKITSIIGPSGCGKSTLLRAVNRMNEEITKVTNSGRIIIGGENILSDNTNVMLLRTKIGMIFQKPQPFPRSIYYNIAFGPRLHGVKNKEQLDEIVEKSLRDVGLWEEVKDRLSEHSFGLSGGQQQRLCVARTLAVNPVIILADEPSSALDPLAAFTLEDLLLDLKERYTIVIVTHNMQQAARLSDYCLFMYNGNVIEYDATSKIFEKPFYELTENYISGRFG